MEKQDILILAQKYQWAFDFNNQPNPLMISVFKDGMRINVYYTTMTVSTALEHPKKGKTQMYRKNVSANLLEKIFKDPRHHTGKGYFKKPVNHMSDQYDENK